MPQLLKFSICSTSTWNGGIVGKIDRVRQRAQEAILDRKEAAPQESEDVREEVPDPRGRRSPRVCCLCLPGGRSPRVCCTHPRWEEVTPSLLPLPPRWEAPTLSWKPTESEAH